MDALAVQSVRRGVKLDDRVVERRGRLDKLEATLSASGVSGGSFSRRATRAMRHTSQSHETSTMEMRRLPGLFWSSASCAVVSSRGQPGAQNPPFSNTLVNGAICGPGQREFRGTREKARRTLE